MSRINQDNDWGMPNSTRPSSTATSLSRSRSTRSCPQVCHARLNADPQYPLRGRPAVYGMYDEVLANTYSSKYRKETFRQGGPPRMALVRSAGR